MVVFDTLTFFLAVVILASIPSASNALVVAKAASAGFKSGAFAALGIVVADLFFVLIAILGLSLLVEKAIFEYLKYVAALFLFCVGVGLLWPTKSPERQVARQNSVEYSSSFLAGIIITLCDVKAVIFYFSLLPILIDGERLTFTEMILVFFLTAIGVGGIKLLYAYMAKVVTDRYFNKGTDKTFRRIYGILMIMIAVYLMLFK